jgi:SHS2 domain-containing protein
VFRGAIAALYAALGKGDDTGIRPVLPVTVTVCEANLDEALVAMLNEILFMLETQDLLLPVDCEVDITQGNGHVTVCAQGLGDRYSSGRYGQFREIKAATLHGLALTCDDAGFRARVVFDV